MYYKQNLCLVKIAPERLMNSGLVVTSLKGIM